MYKTYKTDCGNPQPGSSDNSASETEHDLAITDELLQKWDSIQKTLKEKLILQDTDKWAIHFSNGDSEASDLRYIGGIDVSFVKTNPKIACAALVILSFPDLQVVKEDITLEEINVPYKAGFLAFREVDFFVKKIKTLQENDPHLIPQVILVDGNGILHQNRLGLASHLGVLLDIPSIGVAKDLLQVDGLEKDASFREKISSLKHGGDTFLLETNTKEILGKALRSCDNSPNPVYVSVGHKLCLDTAVEITKRCCRYRVPEPIRQADILSRQYLREKYPP